MNIARPAWSAAIATRLARGLNFGGRCRRGGSSAAVSQTARSPAGPPSRRGLVVLGHGAQPLGVGDAESSEMRTLNAGGRGIASRCSSDTRRNCAASSPRSSSIEMFIVSAALKRAARRLLSQAPRDEQRRDRGVDGVVATVLDMVVAFLAPGPGRSPVGSRSINATTVGVALH